MLHTAAIIGDIVGSRQAENRDELQHQFLAALNRTNETTQPDVMLRITRGDEFEGAYASLGAAWYASLMLRLLMKADGHDLWMSVAWDEVTAFPDADEAAAQDGPAWWNARAALTQLKESSRQKSPANRRTVFVTGGSYPGLEVAAVLRDEVIARIDTVDAAIALGLMNDIAQVDIANDLGISPGVVSRRAHRNGLHSLVIASRASS